MAFNIDADPINANWLRWKNWDVSVQTLEELLTLLEVADASRAEQVATLTRLNKFYDKAPLALQEQVQSFLAG